MLPTITDGPRRPATRSPLPPASEPPVQGLDTTLLKEWLTIGQSNLHKQQAIGGVALAQVNPSLESGVPTTPIHSVSETAPDLRALVEERDQIMTDVIALTAHWPSGDEGDDLQDLAGNVRQRLAMLETIDQRIGSMLAASDPDDRVAQAELSRSMSELRKATLPFEIAAIEHELLQQGIPFKPGQLCVLAPPPTDQPLPTDLVMTLAKLYASDGTSAGADLAARLLITWILGQTARPGQESAALWRCAELLSDVILPATSPGERQRWLGTDSLAHGQGIVRIEATLRDPTLSSRECFEKVMGSHVLTWVLSLKLLDVSPWTPELYGLAEHLMSTHRVLQLIGQETPPWAGGAQIEFHRRMKTAPSPLSTPTSADEYQARRRECVKALFELYPDTGHIENFQDEFQGSLRQHVTYAIPTPGGLVHGQAWGSPGWMTTFPQHLVRYETFEVVTEARPLQAVPGTPSSYLKKFE